MSRIRPSAEALAERVMERMPRLRLVVAAGRHEYDTGGGLLASGIAYRLYVWLIPLGLAAAAAGRMLGVETEADLEQAADSRGIGAVIVSIERQALDASGAEPLLQLAIGLAIAIWLGNGVVRALKAVFAIAWEQPIVKPRNRVVAGAAFTMVAVSLMALAARLGDLYAAIGIPSSALLITKIIVFGVVTLWVSTLLPHRDVPWTALVPGALLVSCGTALLQLVVDVYIAPKLADSASTYGMLGTATVILLWLYLVARLLSVSAFLNAALSPAPETTAGGDDVGSAMPDAR